ncbi:MAG: carboxylating nicotinate-nucleotide diphosphorylase [Actinomycetota bacterium]|nr:carboxylating nicotinate-nucleotide diphosphorylase [Actinomycetota bacterium]
MPSPEPAEVAGDDAWDRVGAQPTGEAAEAAAAPVRPEPAVDVDGDETARGLRRVVVRALAEDLGPLGDLTSQACVPPQQHATARIVSRQPGVVAGVAAIREVYAHVDPRVEVELDAADGDAVQAGDPLATVRGPLRAILAGERTALNIVGHLSGIATTVRSYVDAVAGTGCAIRDTRQATPGLRLLEKAAVRAAGGTNGRIGLHDALLVNQHHIAAAGGVGPAARAALERAGTRPVQVQVTAADEIEQAIVAGATDLLLRGLTPHDVRVAVEGIAGRARVEVSGPISVSEARAYADAGVDGIAVGPRTGAGWLDVGLEVAAEPDEAPVPGSDDVGEDWLFGPPENG